MFKFQTSADSEMKLKQPETAREVWHLLISLL